MDNFYHHLRFAVSKVKDEMIFDSIQYYTYELKKIISRAGGRA